MIKWTFPSIENTALARVTGGLFIGVRREQTNKEACLEYVKKACRKESECDDVDKLDKKKK
jgi:hypothetical protein